MLRLSFDELVEAPERALRACLDFLGEPYARECLRPLRGLRARKLHPGATVSADGEDEPRQAARRLSASLLDAPESVEAGRSRIRTVSRQATREILAAHVPAGSIVAVVSRGDHELLNVAHCDAVHFPQDDAGNWLGFHPQDDTDAIRSLERIHVRGARVPVHPRHVALVARVLRRAAAAARAAARDGARRRVRHALWARG